MAAAYGDVNSPICLAHADARIAYCKTKPDTLCGFEDGTHLPKWRFTKNTVSSGHRKDKRAIAKSYNTNNKLAIGAQQIKARAAYATSHNLPLNQVTDAMVASLGVDH